MIKIIIQIEEEGGPQASIVACGQSFGGAPEQSEKDMAAKIMEALHAICAEHADDMMIHGAIVDRSKPNG